MTLFNIVLALILLAFIGLGLKDGFIVSLGRIIGAIIGFLAAKAFYVSSAPLLTWLMPEGWAKIAMFAIIFILVTRLMGWIFSSLDKTYNFLAKLPFMKSANHLLGALIGLIEGIVIIGGVVWVIKTFKLVPFAATYIEQSTLAISIYKIFLTFLGILL